MKAQDFIKEFAPWMADKEKIDYSDCLALMEAFASKRVIEYADRNRPMQDKPKSND